MRAGDIVIRKADGKRCRITSVGDDGSIWYDSEDGLSSGHRSRYDFVPEPMNSAQALGAYDNASTPHGYAMQLDPKQWLTNDFVHEVGAIHDRIRNAHARLATERKVEKLGAFVGAELAARLDDMTQRNNSLSDKCGALTTENTQLLAENARLRRRVEDLERKAKVRR